MIKYHSVVVFKEYLEFNCGSGEWTVEVDDSFAYQTNDEDCGMFVCMNMKALINRYLNPSQAFILDYSCVSGR
jgi:hypothetical protein